MKDIVHALALYLSNGHAATDGHAKARTGSYYSSSGEHYMSQELCAQGQTLHRSFSENGTKYELQQYACNDMRY
jgi:hypothetical protein